MGALNVHGQEHPFYHGLGGPSLNLVLTHHMLMVWWAVGNCGLTYA